MDYQTALQTDIEQLVRQAPRPIPRHLVAEKLRVSGRVAPPELVHGAVARLMARGRLAEHGGGLVALTVSLPYGARAPTAPMPMMAR